MDSPVESIASRLYQFSSVGCVLGIHYANDNFVSIGLGSSLPLFVALFFVVVGITRCACSYLFPTHCTKQCNLLDLELDKELN